MAEVLLKFYIKERQNLPKINNFFVICVNLQNFTHLILFQADSGK